MRRQETGSEPYTDKRIRKLRLLIRIEVPLVRLTPCLLSVGLDDVLLDHGPVSTLLPINMDG